MLAVALAPSLTADTIQYEHRVVVPTTARVYDSEISASLEKNVNALAAHGYELTTIVGGDAVVLDAILKRRPYSTLGADDAAIALAVMARPVGRPSIARQYRLLHVREIESVAQAVAPLGAEGYRLKFTEIDGAVVHVVFERAGEAPPVEYREFRNKGRTSWMEQLLGDADVRARMMRVAPVALGAGIVELGPRQATPGDVSWLSKPTHAFEQLEGRITEMAKAGHSVQMVRRRGPNDLDVLMVKPAGVTSAGIDVDLDDGPWGSACGRGVIAGAAVGPDGDVYCAADRSRASAVSNRGLDLTVRPMPSEGGAVLFRGPTCDLQARLRSSRPAARRVAFAVQFEQEIARAIESGYRVVRALAAVDHNQQARIVTFTSNAAGDVPKGTAANPAPAPPLVAELDLVGSDLMRQREAAVNAALVTRRPGDHDLWVELTGRPFASASVLGCVTSRLERDAAVSAARGALSDEGLAGIRLVDNLVVR
jgi:hypothetical protein